MYSVSVLILLMRKDSARLTLKEEEERKNRTICVGDDFWYHFSTNVCQQVIFAQKIRLIIRWLKSIRYTQTVVRSVYTPP